MFHARFSIPHQSGLWTDTKCHSFISWVAQLSQSCQIYVILSKWYICAVQAFLLHSRYTLELMIPFNHLKNSYIIISTLLLIYPQLVLATSNKSLHFWLTIYKENFWGIFPITFVWNQELFQTTLHTNRQQFLPGLFTFSHIWVLYSGHEKLNHFITSGNYVMQSGQTR